MLNGTVTYAHDSMGNNVLHCAAQWQLDEKTIQLIAERGAPKDETNFEGETPLFIAVRGDSVPTIRALLGADVSIAGRDSLGNTALHAAVRYDAEAAAKALLDWGADVNAYNLYGKTPLHDAVHEDAFEIEKIFVQSKKANLEARDKDGNTPLMEAVAIGSFRSADYLVKSGADVTTRNNDGDTPLLVTVQNERSDLVALFLDRGAQIHAKNADGESPFTIALKTSPRMMLTLLSKGKDQTDDEGRSPLHIALMYNMPEADIEKIASWVGKNNAVDREGRTALRYAVDRGNWDAAKFLANEGADVFSLARDSKTPADIVLAVANREAIRAVFGGKAVSARDSGGNTVLHYAARVSPPETISLLLELGADKAIRNTSGDIPADIAQRWNRTDIAAMLR
jgi:ankyrin repeat protein